MIDFEYITHVIDLLSEDLVVNYHIPENFIYCSSNKDTSVSVWLVEPVTGKKSKLVFKVNQPSKCFSFAIKNEKIPQITIPDKANLKVKKSDKLNTYVEVPLEHEDINGFIKQVLEKYIESFEPCDRFGCCSKYLKCSEVGHCIHDNKFYAKACWYRKNLETEKNFYKPIK